MKRLFILQVLLVLVLAGVWVLFNHRAALSVLFGGFACIVPNLYFAKRFFSLKHTRRPQQILVAFYIGEFGKMLISALLMVLAIVYLNLHILPTVLGYLVASVAFWMAPVMVLKQQQARSG